MAKDKTSHITVVMADGDIERIAVKQPRLTANFLLQQSSLAMQDDPESFMIGQVFLFAAELRRSNGELIFEDFEDAAHRLHHTATSTLFDMISTNEDMKEIHKQSNSVNKDTVSEEEPTDPKPQ